MLTGAKIDVAGAVTVECNNTNAIVTSIVALTNDPVRVASFEFRAKNGNAVIQELSLANVLAPMATVATGYDSNNLAARGYDNSADGVMLELYVGSTKVGEATLINAIAYSINLNGGAGILLPNNTSVVVDVKAKGTTNSTSLTKVLRLGVVPNVGYSVLGGTAQTMVAAQNSSASATLLSCGNVANAQLVRNTKLTVNSALSPTVGWLNQWSSNFLFKGSLITAGSSMKLSKVVFTYSSNATPIITAPKLMIDGSEYSASQWNATSTVTANTVTMMLNTPLSISASSVALDLKADVTYTDTASVQEYISTRILKGPVDYAWYPTAGAVTGAATIVWSANDGSNDVYYGDSGIAGLETDSYAIKN